ncbi:MAG TPA: flagellar basal body P-ring protein FlgI, partial [Opitutus sp.]|nr:flagellar basal body P-ring protein FlgI [Opitutus sp.]
MLLPLLFPVRRGLAGHLTTAPLARGMASIVRGAGLGLLIFALFCMLVSTVHASRVKDLTLVEGGRDNQIVGYGIVVGLAGDGDSNAATTLRSVSNILARYGLTVNSTDIKAKNAAAVMITADIGAFLKPGTRIDVHVASMGDAKSLQGGVLLQTPLLGA